MILCLLRLPRYSEAEQRKRGNLSALHQIHAASTPPHPHIPLPLPLPPSMRPNRPTPHAFAGNLLRRRARNPTMISQK